MSRQIALIQTIKKFCETLQEYDIDEVTGTYDGSGDSGDMDFMFKRMFRRQNIGNAEPTVTTNYLNERDAEALVTTNGSGTASTKAFNEFIDAVWSLLPGGWEINDGAFGSIHIDTRQKTVQVEHNERYTEITTTESTF